VGVGQSPGEQGTPESILGKFIFISVFFLLSYGQLN